MFVSGSMTDILWPAMAALGVEHALCSEPVVVDEHYTGELWRTAIGEHKALHAQRYAQERGQPLAACYAFGDHISDLPLLVAGWQPLRGQSVRGAAGGVAASGMAGAVV